MIHFQIAIHTKLVQWLLFLLTSDNGLVVVLATKILARLLVVSGTSYMRKFEEKTGGIVIMQRQLKRWWRLPSIWPICLAILFGQDIAALNLERDFNLFNLLDALDASQYSRVVYPEIFPVLAAMLENGLRAITKAQSDPNSPTNGEPDARKSPTDHAPELPSAHRRTQSMSIKGELAPLGKSLWQLLRFSDAHRNRHHGTLFQQHC